MAKGDIVMDWVLGKERAMAPAGCYSGKEEVIIAIFFWFRLQRNVRLTTINGMECGM
jgi:hypothetical protein